MTMLQRILRAVEAVGVLLLAEFLVVVLVTYDQFASIWEVQYGTLWVLPAVCLAAVPLAVTGALLSSSLDRADRRAHRMALGLLSAGFLGTVAWGVSTGRHFSVLSVRLAFVGLLAAGAAAAAYRLVPGLGRLKSRTPLRFMALMLILAVVCEVLNRWVLVRLYDAFHLGLAVLSVVCVGLLGASGSSAVASSARSTQARLLTLAALLLLSAVSVTPASGRLTRFDNYRMLMSESAPLWGRAVLLASRLAPDSVGSTTSDCEPGDDGCGAAPVANTRALDWSGRNLLLITVDALRADHLGSYGYHRDITPHMDRLATEGTRFEYAYCATPHTSYSVTSLMTGKYMRPLLTRGLAGDSETWAGLLRRYGYATAAFFPPAVFFIDTERFAPFVENSFGFEYVKKEFLEGPPRVEQFRQYLKKAPTDRPLFAWVHLFGPHEPYEQHPAFDFGDRDVDRYDSEIAYADKTIGALVHEFRQRHPRGIVMLTSDHGEEFGDHGGRYHGSSVYEEQVRVPLLISVPGARALPTSAHPAQTIDLLPTVLDAVGIPPRPRIRGRSLAAPIAGQPRRGGEAFSETDEYSLLAKGMSRLVCARKIGACRLYILDDDPKQKRDQSSKFPDRTRELRLQLQRLGASHGRFEKASLRANGRAWPPSILRGAAGDGDAAPDIASLLDDADVEIRQRAASLLFQLKRQDIAPALRLALGREEDAVTRRWLAVALSRLGQGAPLTYDILRDGDGAWKQRAALALADSGESRGAAILVAWWRKHARRDYEQARQVLDALARIRFEDAVWPLTRTLNDVRLRPHIAVALQAIGDDTARGPLTIALRRETRHSNRIILIRALLKLGAGRELARPLIRFLAAPDPLPEGLGVALEAEILEHIGGPSEKSMKRLAKNATLGEKVTVVVPRLKRAVGTRLIVRAANSTQGPVVVRVAPSHVVHVLPGSSSKRNRTIPTLDVERGTQLTFPSGVTEQFLELPEGFGAKPGKSVALVFYASSDLTVQALAVVPRLAPDQVIVDPEKTDAGAVDGQSPAK